MTNKSQASLTLSILYDVIGMLLKKIWIEVLKKRILEMCFVNQTKNKQNYTNAEEMKIVCVRFL